MVLPKKVSAPTAVTVASSSPCATTAPDKIWHAPQQVFARATNRPPWDTPDTTEQQRTSKLVDDVRNAQHAQPLCDSRAPVRACHAHYSVGVWLTVSPGRRVTASDSPVREDSSIFSGSPGPSSCASRVCMIRTQVDVNLLAGPDTRI